MSKFTDRAYELRNDPVTHYNCAQAVMLPFAEEKDIPADIAMKFADNFGGGMRTASVCGAITGGLMALGLCGAGTPADAQLLFKMIRKNHDGLIMCADLLKVSHDKGEVKKEHCDGMVYESVNAVEAILKGKGLL